MTDKETWTVIVRGKAAIAMTEEVARKWREGGTKGKEEETEDNRVMTIEIPRRGWEKGITFMATYEPIGSARKAEWDKLFKEKRKMIETSPTDNMLILGGDYNSGIGTDEHTT